MKGAWRAGLVLWGLLLVLSAVGCGGREEAVPDAKTDAPLGWVDRLRVGEPAGYENLRIFPVFAQTPAIGKEYLTLEEGIRDKLVRVTEVGRRETSEETAMTVARIEAAHAARTTSEDADDEGDVGKLLIHNHSDKPLFILAGQTVCGGKQDRICPEDVVVAPRTSNFAIEVFCVESGRWHVGPGTAVSFGFSEVAVDDVRKVARAEKDQSKVWKKVKDVSVVTQEAVGYDPEIGSGTSAYLEAATDPKLKARVKPYVDALAAKWKDEKDLAGYVVVIDGRVRSLDVFNDAATFAKLRGDLLESYATAAALAKALAEKGKKPETPGTSETPQTPVTVADVEKFLKTAYTRRGELSTSGAFVIESDGGASLFGSAGGEMKATEKGVQHLYLTIEKPTEPSEKKEPSEPKEEPRPAEKTPDATPED